jgi:hypothetical protein
MSRDQWVKAPAQVFSVEWQSKAGHEDGHWHIVYNDSVGDTFYSGEFFDAGFEGGAHVRRDDVFDVEYLANDPSRSRYPAVRPRRKATWVYFGIGGALAILVMIVVFLSGGFER